MDIRKRDRHGGGILMPFAFFSCLLLAVLIADVVWLMPPRTPEQRRIWVPMHQSFRNFIIAQKMISRLAPSPPTRWLARIKCGEIGHGVWYAEGVVGLETFPGQETPTPWRVLFVPATLQALYLNLGPREEGDLAAALRQAGLHPDKP